MKIYIRILVILLHSYIQALYAQGFIRRITEFGIKAGTGVTVAVPLQRYQWNIDVGNREFALFFTHMINESANGYHVELGYRDQVSYQLSIPQSDIQWTPQLEYIQLTGCWKFRPHIHNRARELSFLLGGRFLYKLVLSSQEQYQSPDIVPTALFALWGKFTLGGRQTPARGLSCFWQLGGELAITQILKIYPPDGAYVWGGQLFGALGVTLFKKSGQKYTVPRFKKRKRPRLILD
jgi:hypothetical protein